MNRSMQLLVLVKYCLSPRQTFYTMFELLQETLCALCWQQKRMYIKDKLKDKFCSD